MSYLVGTHVSGALPPPLPRSRELWMLSLGQSLDWRYQKGSSRKKKKKKRVSKKRKKKRKMQQ